jgi:hypothetical protein
MCSHRRCCDVVVEVAEHDVNVVELVMVDDVVVVGGVAAFVGGAKNCTDFFFLFFGWSWSTVCTLKGTVGDVLHMSEDVVISEINSFLLVWRKLTERRTVFARTVCAVVGASQL